MLIPQTEESDFDANDCQVDDINSLVEYVDQVVLENPDGTPEDEDNDTARNYNLTQIDFYCNKCSVEIPSHGFSHKGKNFFPEFAANKIPSISFDIVAPPPKGQTSSNNYLNIYLLKASISRFLIIFLFILTWNFSL